MKAEKGITLTSLIIYVTAMSIVVGIVTVISTYFYNNVSTVTKNSNKYKQYTKFNSYFIQEINISNNAVEECNGNLIKFSNGNQYTFQNDSIYFNKIKICENIKECLFENIIDKNGKNVVTVKLAVQEENNIFSTNYTLKDW